MDIWNVLVNGTESGGNPREVCLNLHEHIYIGMVLTPRL